MFSVLAIEVVLAAKKTTSGSSAITNVLIITVIFGAIYFVFLRPRQQRQRQALQEVKGAQVGDEVQTIGGLIGTIVAEDGDRVTISTGNGTEVVFLRQAIRGKATPPASAATDAHDEPLATPVDEEFEGPVPGFSNDGATEEPEKK